MYAMFVKEMQQFFRSLALKISGLLIIGSWLMVYFIHQLNVPDEAGLAELAKSNKYAFAALGGSLIAYLLAIIAMNVAALIAVIGSSAGRWRLELGDPAFAPGITTCTPPWKLALGKWSALMLQVLFILLLCGLLPFWFGTDSGILACLAEDRRWTSAEAMTYICKTPLVMVCMAVVWSSMTLALCSLKPRSRSKVDIGMVAAMLFLAPQAFGLLLGSTGDNWLVNMLIRAGVLIIGSLALITAGVSAPGANRLFLFKSWITLSVLVIMPFLWKLQVGFRRENWSEMLKLCSCFFLLCSLFERTVQSRRVLSQLSNPVIALITFPFTTGVLNSMVLAAGFAVAAHFIDPGCFAGSDVAEMLTVAAMISLCNMAGFFFENKGRKFVRFVAFLLLIFFGGVVLGIAGANGIEISKWISRREIVIVMAILTLGCNIPLIINYNSRKKSL